MKFRSLLFTTCASIILCMFTINATAQPGLSVHAQVSPAACATGIQHVLIETTIINPDPLSSYSVCFLGDESGDTLLCYGGFDISSNFQNSLIYDFAVAGSHTLKVYLESNAPTPPYYSDSVIIYTDSLCMNSIIGSMNANTVNSCTQGNTVTSPVKLRLDRNGIPNDTLTGLGVYSYLFTPPYTDSLYTLTPISLPLGYTLSCPATGNYEFVLDTINRNNLSFGLNCASTTGFDLYGYMSGIYRGPGSASGTSHLDISAGNAACASQDAVVTLNIDPAYTYASATIAPSSVSGQVITWNLNNLNATSSRYIVVTLNPGSTAVMGNVACSNLTINPVAGDANAANNAFSFCDTIRAAWDPNNKFVDPAGDIAAGTLLTYTVNFENLGNDTAYKVAIVDTLSPNLDLSTFELVTASHPVSIVFGAAGNTKIARFEFPGIRLTDKNHPAGNKGFVMYRAKAKSNLAAGSAIANTAHIYFDNNPDVVTNTVLNKIPALISVREIKKQDDIRIYPNPADNMLFVENREGHYKQLAIFNLLGQMMQQQSIQPGLNSIKIPTLYPGMYYVVVSGPEAVLSKKITKK